MKRKTGSQRGFTLIEVLIVVVVIGVLAALILPRFLSAPEKAIVAEANQMLGAIIRSQQRSIDSGVGFVSTTASSTDSTWNRIGMLTPGTLKFTYTCTSPSCTATRTVGTVSSTVVAHTSGVAFTCSGAYTTAGNGGCALA